MPIKDVGFNPEVILRRFYNIGINFSENAIFFHNCSKSPSTCSRKKSKELLFF